MRGVVLGRVAKAVDRLPSARGGYANRQGGKSSAYRGIIEEMDNSETVISIDVEWAHPEVLADVVRLLDEREIRATFFCTHEGIRLFR